MAIYKLIRFVLSIPRRIKDTLTRWEYETRCWQPYADNSGYLFATLMLFFPSWSFGKTQEFIIMNRRVIRVVESHTGRYPQKKGWYISKEGA